MKTLSTVGKTFCGIPPLYQHTLICDVFLICRLIVTKKKINIIASHSRRAWCYRWLLCSSCQRLMLMLGGPKIMKLFSWCALWEQQLTMRDFSNHWKNSLSPAQPSLGGETIAAKPYTTSHNHVRCWMELEKLFQKKPSSTLKKTWGNYLALIVRHRVDNLAM